MIRNSPPTHPPVTASSAGVSISFHACLTSTACKQTSLNETPAKEVANVHNITNDIVIFYSPETLTVTYPFFYQATPLEQKMENGWHLFSIDTYFMKMFQKTENWRLSSVNNDYKVDNIEKILNLFAYS